jgi:diguanylate cyclase (GGDEF)-like protein/PAS domain S-box-containing protein
MKDHEKTKTQLIEDIAVLRQQCVDLDLSAHEATLEEARISEVIWQQQAILDNIPDNVWLKDSEGLYVSVNDPFGKDVGVTREDIVGKNDYDIYPAELAAKYERDSREVMTSGDRTYFEESIVDQEGNIQYLEKVETPIFDDNGKVSGIIGIGHDITSRKELEIALRHDCTHDTLTGLFNRAYFDTELERLSRGRMFPLSIVIADLNNLKAVNDALGHEAGDNLIRLAAGILHGVFRCEDIVARIGGDEFAVLLPLTDEKTAVLAVNRLKHCPEICSGQVSIAFGISAAENRDQLSEALRLADERMYRNKSDQKQQKEGEMDRV